MVDWHQKVSELGISEAFPFAQEALEKIESHHKAKLPTVYRHFLETYGYSSFDVATIVRFGPEDQFAFGVNDFSSKEMLLNFEVLDEVLPKQVVPFGHDSFGNSACISLRSDTYGKVYWYDHNQVPSIHDVADDEEHFKCLVLMAESFEAWIEKLEVNE